MTDTIVQKSAAAYTNAWGVIFSGVKPAAS